MYLAESKGDAVKCMIGDPKPGTPNFITQLSQDNWPSVLFAMAGGIVLSVGNLSKQYAWALVGISVVEVVSASITVVIGATLNYFLDGRINKAEILFSGVGCFLIASFLGAAVHKSNASDNKAKLISLSTDLEELAGNNSDGTFAINNISESDSGPALFLVQLEEIRSIKVFGRNIWIGMAITVFAGLCFSLFSPLFNVATNDQFHYLKKGIPHLADYTAFFYYSISAFLVAFILNIIFLYHPIMGLPKSSFRAYLRDRNERGSALFAGFLCGFGNGVQFMAGYASAGPLQVLPLVSTFWGVVIFREYTKSSRRTYVLLANTLLVFIAAVGILMASAVQKKS
ncbi:ureide permease 2-like isoform X2 [Silene latifolia]|uniref:ureide permease 2-like isoform X2 n=1 Tax=Silene latifolia TaxID=37657 RepID=UPI003D7747A0